MADVHGVNPSGPSTRANQPIDDPVTRTGAQPAPSEVPTGPPGELGQPTGMPAPAAPGQAGVLSDVLAGQDPTQLKAAELLRANGGVSATEKLLGLNLQPPIAGAFFPPPGNNEALRHMTTTMRRTAMRNLLRKQQERMRRLEEKLKRQNEDSSEHTEDENEYLQAEHTEMILSQRERARRELGRAGMMLGLLEELLAMQDYTISQMGTFSKG